MALSISSPAHSFVRFSDQHLEGISWNESPWPGATMGFAVPFSGKDDLAFQFYVNGEEFEIDAICLIPLTNWYYKISEGSFLGPALSNLQYAAIPGIPFGTYFSFAPYMEMYRVSPTRALFYVSSLGGLNPVQDYITEGSCFQIAIHLDDLGHLISAVSNVFRFIHNDTQYTTLLEYDSEINEAGFIYEPSPSIKSRVRLPLYLTRPTLPEEETVYRLSDGSSAITKAVIRKQFEVVTDAMPIWMNEALRAIWLHDRVETLANLVYEGEIVKEGAFEMEYIQYMNHPFAVVKFKVSASPYLLRKNNCGAATNYSGLLQLADLSLGGYLSNHTYTVNLSSVIVAACCAPLTYQIAYYQSSRIVFINLVGNILTIRTRPFGGSLGMPGPFVRIKASCGAIVAFSQITVS